MPGSGRSGKPDRSRSAGKPSARKPARRTTAKPAPARQTPAKRGHGLAERARAVAGLLAAEYPDARCMLDHSSPFELLVATVLAAQCTDERVNMVTPALFRRFPTPEAMAVADIAELEEMIRSTGFFHNKAKSIKGAAQALAASYPGSFPQTMDELLTLPGVGRKTANVILGTCFGAPAIVVDTHFSRVTQRIGLATSGDPGEIEKEVGALLPPEKWTAFSNAVTFHGRRCCAARTPDHARCPIARLCDSRDI